LRLPAVSAKLRPMARAVARFLSYFFVPGIVLGAALPAVRAEQEPAGAAATEAHRTNGITTLQALKPLAIGVRGCTVEVLNEQGRAVLLAVQVSADGYLLTKASEAPTAATFSVRQPDGIICRARRVREERTMDLLLAKVDATDSMAAPWATASQREPGTWVIAPTVEAAQSQPPVRLGVLSAKKRVISPGGAGMGIRMRDDLQQKAVRIIEVSVDGPARTAGLLEGDVVVALQDEPTPSADRFQSILRRHQPGDQIKVDYLRGAKREELQVRLASLTQVVSNFDGDDYGNGGVSIRTDGFPMVLQHATPLSPRDMGGALFDLEGNAIGINIARADRVTTFALPVEVFWARAQEWMQRDRLERPAE
jgi:serine protease Do